MENLWQAILAFAMRRNVQLRRLEPSAVLRDHGGIAALLVRDEPGWEAAASEAGKSKKVP
jgi:hypothetical protein